MAQVNLFLLLPETEPKNRWMRSTQADFDQVEAYENLIQALKGIIERIAIEERYAGFYDALNVKNFFYLYDTLDDCYPAAPKRRLQSAINRNDFMDWREDKIQSPDRNYLIFNQPISDNTFCEIAERKNKIGADKYILLNHHACTINEIFIVIINKKHSIEIHPLMDEEEIFKWFSKNRLPRRTFQTNPKHGENRQEVLFVNGEEVSPLRCSEQEAQLLLDTAIGNSEKGLYNMDPDHDEIIVFKYEGSTPQNAYHGYHVPKNTEGVPSDIRKRLMSSGAKAIQGRR